jgi:hypothetical protein
VSTNEYPALELKQDGTVWNTGFVNFNGEPNPAFLRGPFPFTHSTAGLTSGVPIYTPAIGDVIYDVLISVPVAFNGTTPFADVGTFNGGNDGLFLELAGVAVDLTAADTGIADNTGLSGNIYSLLGGALWASSSPPGNGPFTIFVTAANPLLLVVSQTGAKGGTATGATAGSGAVYVLAATPQAFTTPSSP